MATNEDLVEIDLRRSVQIRAPGGAIGPSFGPGRVKVPRSFAESLGATVQAQPQQAATTGPADGPVNPPPHGDTTGNGNTANAVPPAETDAQAKARREAEELFEGLTRAELEEEAKLRGLEVTRADGKAGDPLVGDYQRVLVEHQLSKAS